MSGLLRAWYLFLALGLLTFVLVAFVGVAPLSLSTTVALPHRMLFTATVNLRQAAISARERRDYRGEVARLENDVAELQSLNRSLELELERYRQALAIKEAQSPGVVTTAAVTGVDSSPLLSRITLGVGRDAGLKLNMPVTVPDGLVGLVTAVTARNASVRTITDPESRVGVTVRGRGGQGIARGELGGLIRVMNYSENAPIEVGDLVETSSRGGFFPVGIVVGEVIEISPRDANSLRRNFLVRPAVEIPNLQQVALIEPL